VLIRTIAARPRTDQAGQKASVPVCLPSSHCSSVFCRCESRSRRSGCHNPSRL
jgi:hypothetical protein